MPDIATVLALEVGIHRRVASFHLVSLRPLVRQAFFIIPAWMLLTWIAFFIEVRPR